MMGSAQSAMGYQQQQNSQYNNALTGAAQGYQQNSQVPMIDSLYDPYTDSYRYPDGSAKTSSGFNKQKETHMVTEVAQDMKKFIRDHKSTIYVIALLLVVDHFMFNGALKEKLKSLVQNLVGKVEAKLNETKV